MFIEGLLPQRQQQVPNGRPGIALLPLPIGHFEQHIGHQKALNPGGNQARFRRFKESQQTLVALKYCAAGTVHGITLMYPILH
jgi:hypothetical protein